MPTFSLRYNWLLSPHSYRILRLTVVTYADPSRIALIGGSFGGYLTFACATKTEDLFKCGVTLNGLTDLISYIDYHKKQNSRELGWYQVW